MNNNGKKVALFLGLCVVASVAALLLIRCTASPRVEPQVDPMQQERIEEH